MKILINVFIFFFFSRALLCAGDYAPFDIYATYNRMVGYQEFSQLYPDLKENEKFKPEISNQNDFLKKYPQVTFLTLTDLTKELGAIAWLTTTNSSNVVSGILSSFEKSMEKPRENDFLDDKEKAKISSLPENASYEDWIYWFYSKNFISPVLKAKYAAEKYIYGTLTNLLKSEDFKQLNSKTRGLTEEGEWTLCQTFLQTIRDQLELNKSNNLNSVFGLYSTSFITKFSRIMTMPTQALLNFMTTEKEKKDKLFKNHLFMQRKDDGTYLSLYRATIPFEKNGKRVLDDVMKEHQYVLFSYAPSLFSNLVNDTDSCPLSYWWRSSKMQHLKIPYAKAADFIKRKLIFFRPYFGLTNILFGEGEFHPRSGLPKEAFQDDDTWPEFKNHKHYSQGSVHLIPSSAQLFNSGLEFELFQRQYINKFLLPHLTLLEATEDETEAFKAAMKI